jgi:shikimate dehydrogenase
VKPERREERERFVDLVDRYCVMGNPVEHSRSPWIHARFAELTGQRLDYGRRLAPLGGFGAAVAAFRDEAAGAARGCNVTVPFKFEAAALARHLTPRAALAQAVNVLSFREDGIHGDNSDGAGLVNDITAHAGITIAGSDLLLLGAGGAGAGVLGPLIEAGPRRLIVANRTLAKAIALVQRHAALAMKHRITLEAQALDTISGAFDVLVNATASSLAGTACRYPPACSNAAPSRST